MEKLFCVNVNKYVKDHNFDVYCPSSLDYPKDNSVSFLTLQNYDKWKAFEKCQNCLIFWPDVKDAPKEVYLHGHAVVFCKNPHLRFCEFFKENGIDNTPKIEKYDIVNGSFISSGAKIGNNVVIQPGAYISGETTIGNDVYIGSGVKIMGRVKIGNNVIIRENTVLGADGLTTDRDDLGKPVRMPQFGGIVVGSNVVIGANVVIARGAIDDTLIDDDSSIDNCVFVSHNVQIGKRVFVVGESILFGSSRVGDDVFISGNSAIRNGVCIGEKALIGMGAVVINNVAEGKVVKGNPAK